MILLKNFINISDIYYFTIKFTYLSLNHIVFLKYFLSLNLWNKDKEYKRNLLYKFLSKL